MKVLHLSDLHFNQSIFKWMDDQQENYDVLCLTGDFLDLSVNSKVSVKDQIDWIVSFLNNLEKPVFLCSGNHDVIEQDLSQISIEDLFNIDDSIPDYIDSPKNQEDTIWLSSVEIIEGYGDGTIHKVGGVTFGCMPYLSTNYERYRECDVILRHVPPEKTKVSIGEEGDYGCDEFLNILTLGLIKPKYVLSGHIHNPTGHSDEINGIKLYNPGYGYNGTTPKHILFDITP